MDRAVLDAALERTPLGEDGRSGATLDRVVLADGSTVVVKRYDPDRDLVMRMLGDERGREVAVFESGLLHALPPLVHHAILDAWYDDDGLGVVVMRDLGAAVLGWHSRVSAMQSRTVFRAAAQLHATPLAADPGVLTPLREVLGVFEVPRLQRLAGAGLIDLALRGWAHWPEVAPGDVGDRVMALAHDTAPLVAACAQHPPALLHGDLSIVNLALESDRPGTVTLLDWGMTTVGPAEIDVGRLLAGCAHVMDGGLDELVRRYREVMGAAYDADAMRLGLLAGLVWLGWNKALDIVEHPTPHVRERERVNLGWWLHQAAAAFESGVA
ncbi:phosphotransferase family protein [Nocardioides coralli]|uniref:phosphotransferase family protein n=1 Tax=Nocardioides coralli TaxID=2872154 RepID=UPI001CA45B0B|nr:phosphotransferase [Nocardioides coralli]QZY28272.1 phosphotransferase [Nocardioides coralli]